MIDYSQVITAEQKRAAEFKALFDGAISQRRAAYVAESDALRLEADYDALSQDREPDYTAWLVSVAAIKARFPLPVSAEPSDT